MTRTLERGFIKPFINNFLGLLDRKVKRNVPLSPVSKRVKLWEKKQNWDKIQFKLFGNFTSMHAI